MVCDLYAVCVFRDLTSDLVGVPMSDDKKEPGDADDAPASDDAPAVAERTPLDLFLEAIDQSKYCRS